MIKRPLKKENYTTVKIYSETFEYLKRSSYYHNKSIAELIAELVEEPEEPFISENNHNTTIQEDLHYLYEDSDVLDTLNKPTVMLKDTHKRSTFLVRKENSEWLDQTAGKVRNKRFKTDFINYAIEEAIKEFEARSS